MRDGRWTLAAALVGGVAAANAAFAGLGSVFDYPGVLAEPAGTILDRFAANPHVIGGWFLLLAFGAGLLVPAAVLLGRRLPPGTATTLAVHTGVLAGLVQVLGLLRWPFAVPALADAHAADPATTEAVFTVLHHYLGTAVGETLGYLLTASWTLLVLRAMPGAPRWFAGLAALSALAVAAGIVVPLDVPGADAANFLGYVAWSAWMIALAVLVVRDRAFAARPRPVAVPAV
ncbi:DUF4386 family protein [Actinomadura rayongensis]|uniref:DUF4386 family protein n=1 Tax=Actinomadura rayongensis TaxID=1429076 RepID=A0A6I4W9Q1_9ACTN|nr:DUF4386 family protein [Actinomadura rayongensis]MXQ66291.1 DUF4386 family protein [Actinomadura rayongensis]